MLNIIKIVLSRNYLNQTVRLNSPNKKILSKKPYIKPEVTQFVIDNTICLMQMSPGPPGNPDPGTRGGGSKGQDDSFQSPFRDKPFG